MAGHVTLLMCLLPIMVIRGTLSREPGDSIDVYFAYNGGNSDLKLLARLLYSCVS